jgi:hypothetical protein
MDQQELFDAETEAEGPKKIPRSKSQLISRFFFVRAVGFFIAATGMIFDAMLR